MKKILGNIVIISIMLILNTEFLYSQVNLLKTYKLLTDSASEKNYIHAMTISKDSNFLVLAGRTVFVYNLVTGAVEAQFGVGVPPAYSVAISYDNKYIAAGSEYSHVFLWDMENNKSIGTMSVSTDDNILYETVKVLNFIPGTHDLLANNDNGGLSKINIDSLKIVGNIPMYSNDSVFFLYDKRNIVIDKKIIYDTIEKKSNNLNYIDPNYDLLYLSFNGKYMITHRIDNNKHVSHFNLYDIFNNTLINNFTWDYEDIDIKISSSGKYFLYRNLAEVRLYEINKNNSPQNLHTFTFEDDIYYHTTIFTPDDSKIILTNFYKAYVYDISGLTSQIPDATLHK